MLLALLFVALWAGVFATAGASGHFMVLGDLRHGYAFLAAFATLVFVMLALV